MNVKELRDELEKLISEGKGDYPVVYNYLSDISWDSFELCKVSVGLSKGDNIPVVSLEEGDEFRSL